MNNTIETVKVAAEQAMEKTIAALDGNLAKLRTGRAHPSLLEHLRVVQYDQEVPLNHVASVTVCDARTLMVTPWDKSLVQAIEKAILSADLGLNPVTAGATIRVPLAALTEERRREMNKLVKKEAEEARVSIRNHRRDANNALKDLVKKKILTEDDERRGQEIIQKVTDQAISKIEKIVAQKEKELMTI
ncbi:ribosome recycling factor [Rickettsiella massiliensis]|uniref:ribosome recycling factor n=1 Tax=Rickettsiella massiliensis TaxID=676517 RepID=UPI00029A9472|nr:ribosome recycling factor [Rickettsiella massiliensis]